MNLSTSAYFLEQSLMKGSEHMLSKKILISALSITIIGGTIFGIAQVNAQSTAQPYQGLVKVIAQKFNLNQSDVQNVVNQYHQQQQATRQQQLQQRLKARLDTLVQQGKITATQEQAILTEFAKLQNEYSPATMQQLTPQQRRQQFQKRQQELRAWAQSQQINLSLIRPLGHMGSMMRHAH